MRYDNVVSHHQYARTIFVMCARLVSLFPPDGTLERSTDVPEMEEILGLSKDDNDDDGDKRRTMMMMVMMMTVMMVVMI